MEATTKRSRKKRKAADHAGSAPLDPVQTVLGRLHGIARSGDGWMAKCPAHHDEKPSLSVRYGSDGRALLKCHAGCSVDSILEKLGLEKRDLFAHEPRLALAAPPKQTPRTRRSIVAEYDYRNAAGGLLFQTIRYDPKDFRQRRPDGKGGWISNLTGVPRPLPLYRLPELTEALARRPRRQILVVEGEKDVDSIRGLGLLATCNPMGAGKWGQVDQTPLRDRIVVVIPDKDEPGRKHARQVARALHRIARKVRLLELPGEGKDVTDWIEAGGTRDQLVDLARSAPPWEPDAKRGDGSDSLVMIPLVDVAAKPVVWLWPDRIPIGKITLIAGAPGLGKSLVTLDIATRVSAGLRWPDGERIRCSPGDVVLLSAEDDVADTIKPRLIAARADLGRITFLESRRTFDQKAGREILMPFSLERDVPLLQDALLQKPDCRLVIVDPITAYFGRADSHKNSDVRALLAPLAAMAAKAVVAVVAISHLNKTVRQGALERVTGSIALPAAARAVHLVTKDKDDPERRLFLPGKNNLAPDTPGLAYRAKVCRDGVRVAWEADPVTISIDEALRRTGRRPGPEPGEREEAEEWLRGYLQDGPKPARKLFQEAQRDGISRSTLKRAKAAMPVESHKAGMDQGWTWHLAKQP